MAREDTVYTELSQDEDAPDFGFLSSSPLLDPNGNPLVLIDHNSEFSEVFSALRRSQVGLRAVADVGTPRTLGGLQTHGVTMLYFCGHGLATPLSEPPGVEEPSASGFSLVLEDGKGSARSLPASNLHELVAAGGKHLQLVFASACHSLGAAFVRAGVPHVVAVKLSDRIQDGAACIFAEAFYFGRLRGNKTVRQAFDIGRSAVTSTVGIHEASAEAVKVCASPLLL